MDEDGEGPGSDEIACTCVRVSFLSKLIAVETITLERPPDHSITTLLYRHRPRPSVITISLMEKDQVLLLRSSSLFCTNCYVFSLVIHPLSPSLFCLVSLICIILDLIRCRLKSLAREAHDRDRRLSGGLIGCFVALA